MGDMDLSLSIQGDSSSAEAALAQVASGLDNLQGALDGISPASLDSVSESISGLGAASGEAAEGVDATTEGMEEAGASTEQASDEFSNASQAAGQLAGNLTSVAPGLQEVSSGFSSLVSSGNLAEAATGALAVGAAFVGLGMAGGDLVTGLMKTEAALGFSTHDALLYGLALEDVGSSSEKLTSVGWMLQKRLEAVVIEMQAGNQVANPLTMTMAELGITYRDTTGELLSMGEVIPQIFQKLGAMVDQEHAAILAGNLFGRGGAELVPLINNFGEALNTATGQLEASGLATIDVTRLALDYNKATTSLRLEADKLGVQVLPVMSAAIGATTEIMQGGADVARDYANVLKTIAEYTGLQQLGEWLGDFFSKTREWSDALDEFAGVEQRVSLRADEAREAAEDQARAEGLLEDAVKAAGDAAYDAARGIDSNSRALEDNQRAADEASKALDDYVRSLSDADVAASLATPGYASGTTSSKSGMAWVGEEGPELVRLPGGSRVYSNSESRQIAADVDVGVDVGGVTINNYGSVNNVFPNADPRAAMKEVDRLFRGA